MKSPRRVAVTLGDPCGIGPEVAVGVLARSSRLRNACFMVGDRTVVERELRRPGVPRVRLSIAESPEAVGGAGPLWLVNIPYPGLSALRPGRGGALSGLASHTWLRAGAEWARAGRAGALVTGPVSKEAVARTVPGFSGQTEVVARLAGVAEPVMLLAGRRLRVVPATRHIPLSRVPGALSVPRLARSIIATGRGLSRWLGVRRPRVAVCGLNPHAGERGLMGTEERRLISPAIRMARRGGVRAEGPFPADTVYAHALAGKYDVVVAMYHDQALIPIKTVEWGSAVNATLGLPFLRTSPAHGTAFDMAGRGRADRSSMLEALEMGVKAGRRRG